MCVEQALSTQLTSFNDPTHKITLQLPTCNYAAPRNNILFITACFCIASHFRATQYRLSLTAQCFGIKVNQIFANITAGRA